MKALCLSALLQLGSRYGFVGEPGLFAGIIGLIIFIVVIVILWKVFDAVLPKLITDPGWSTAVRWLLILLTFLAFLHFFGIY